MALELVVLVDGIPVYNPELRGIPIFAEIIRRDRGSDGDSQGKKKLIATKELEAIYWFSAWNSPIWQYDEDMWLKKVIEYTGLPNDWKPDKDFLEAVEFFKNEIQKNAALEELVELMDTFKVGTKIVKAARKYLETQIHNIEDNRMVTDGEGRMVSAISQSITMLGDMQQLLKSLPGAIDRIKELENKVKANEGIKGKANRELNPREI